MKYFIAGVSTLLLGVTGISVAIFYAWIAETPGCGKDCNEHYNLISTVIAIPSLLMIASSFIAFMVAYVKRSRTNRLH